MQMTKKGAQAVTDTFDRMATLLQDEWATLGIPQHIANDMAFRCDLLSSSIEQTAGIKREALDGLDVHKEEGFDPEEIGEEKAGPLEDEPDEPYMKDEFTQQENRELREKQEEGELPGGSLEPQSPKPGVQAAMDELTAALAGVEHPQVERAIRLALDVAKVAKAAKHDEGKEVGDKEASSTRERHAHGFNLTA